MVNTAVDISEQFNIVFVDVGEKQKKTRLSSILSQPKKVVFVVVVDVVFVFVCVVFLIVVVVFVVVLVVVVFVVVVIVGPNQNLKFR